MKKFKCPACASEKFGTVHANGLVYGTCHGVVDKREGLSFSFPGYEFTLLHGPRMCMFTWDRADDDKVFVGVEEKP